MSNYLTDYLSKQHNTPVSNATLLNSIREGSSDAYKRDIPELSEHATINHENVPYSKYTEHQNEFFDGLINKVAFQTFRAMDMTPLSERFKKGTMRTGETWEEIFHHLQDPKQYDAKSNVSPFAFKESKVSSFYHDINRQVYYEKTINKDWVEKAMLSEQDFDSHINAMFKSLFSSDKIDETMVIKETMTNMLTPLNVAPPNAPDNFIANKSIKVDLQEQDFVVTWLKEVNNRSRLFSFPNRENPQNAIDEPLETEVENQILVVDSLFSSEIDMVYANLFNMNEASIIARKMVIDEFPIYKGEGKLKGAKPIAILMSEDSLVIKDKVKELHQMFNGRTRNYELFYHHQQMIAYSVIENCIIYYIMPDENGRYNRAMSENAQGMNKGINQGNMSDFIMQTLADMNEKIKLVEQENKELKEQIVSRETNEEVKEVSETKEKETGEKKK